MGRDADFDAFVLAHQVQLVRLGWALTGDRHLGEDLVQAALLRLWRRWPSVDYLVQSRHWKSARLGASLTIAVRAIVERSV